MLARGNFHAGDVYLSRKVRPTAWFAMPNIGRKYIVKKDFPPTSLVLPETRHSNYLFRACLHWQLDRDPIAMQPQRCPYLQLDRDPIAIN